MWLVKRPRNSKYHYFPCPTCGKQSAFCDDLDRTVHTDGTANRECWANVPYDSQLPHWLSPADFIYHEHTLMPKELDKP